MVIIVIGIITWNVCFDTKKATRAANITKTIETGYKATTEEEAVLKKTYEQLIDSADYTVYSNLDKKYDSMSEAKRKNIKTDIERLKKEKNVYDEECQKQSEQNKQVYSDLIKEIESSYPSMRGISISGKDDKKRLLIFMNLLHNITATEEESCSLTIMKETRMKEVGIDSICILVQDTNKKSHGSIIFKLDKGKYQPFANTIQ